jgi:hypothetical protein
MSRQRHHRIGRGKDLVIACLGLLLGILLLAAGQTTWA